MKIWSVFSLVIVFHVFIIGLLLVQPGCQSKPSGKPEPAVAAPARPPAYAEPQPAPTLDPAFNAGIGARRPGTRTLSAPTRPAPSPGLLEPVLEPVRERVDLPGATREYTVVQGDTLSGIARREGIPLSALRSANNLTTSSTIYIGQKLLIPEPAPEQPSTSIYQPTTIDQQPSTNEITVAPGDTLSGLAARHRTTVAAIKALNGLRSDTIRVGQRLQLPAAAVPATAAPAAPAAPAPLTGPTGTYTVQPGDTPSGIASRFGITGQQLMAANNITDPRRLQVGQQLVVPQRSGTAAAAAPAPAPAARAVEPRPATQLLDPAAMLQELEDEDLPFVEVESVEPHASPGN